MENSLIPQVIISSCSGKEGSNWTMDDFNTGNLLTSGKTGESSARTLCLVGQDYLVSAVPESPIINVWHLAKPKQTKKMVVPGIVTALAVSRQGLYLVAAIDSKLHLWQVSTGNLLRILHRHHQNVTCIKFTTDGSYFISGGRDGMTYAWRVSSVLSSEIGNSEELKTNDTVTSSFSWSHTEPVNDIYVGYFGCKGRVATVSDDRTCKLYQLLPGHLLLSVFMDVGLLSVSMDPAERFIFLGAKNGDIHCVTLAHCDTNAIHYDESNDRVFRKFTGHADGVTCLSVSVDGLTLLSASKDKCLKLWNIVSGILSKTVKCEGPITNAFLAMTPPVIKNFRNKKYEVPVIEFETLKRHLHSDEENADEDDSLKNAVPLNLQNHHLKTWELTSGMDILEGMKSAGGSDNSKSQLQEEIGSVKKTNKQMYYYLVDTFISSLEN